MSKKDIITGEGEVIGTVETPNEPIKMVVKTISTTYERKFNLGEYESANLGVTTWADIDPDQDPAIAIEELSELCKAQVRKQALPILRGRKNGGFEFSELQDSYLIMQRILEDALDELAKDHDLDHDQGYASLVERLNALTK
jgi:hypothetical protein